MELKDAEIIVVKVGTSTLTYENGKVNLGRMEQLCRTLLSDLQNSGETVSVLVSSGAIGVGMGKLGLLRSSGRDGEKAGAGGRWPVRAHVYVRQILWRVQSHGGPGTAHRPMWWTRTGAAGTSRAPLGSCFLHGGDPGGQRKRHRWRPARIGRQELRRQRHLVRCGSGALRRPGDWWSSRILTAYMTGTPRRIRKPSGSPGWRRSPRRSKRRSAGGGRFTPGAREGWPAELKAAQRRWRWNKGFPWPLCPAVIPKVCTACSMGKTSAPYFPSRLSLHASRGAVRFAYSQRRKPMARCPRDLTVWGLCPGCFCRKSVAADAH